MAHNAKTEDKPQFDEDNFQAKKSSTCGAA